VDKIVASLIKQVRSSNGIIPERRPNSELALHDVTGANNCVGQQMPGALAVSQAPSK
jgi:hypothetical protein